MVVALVVEVHFPKEVEAQQYEEEVMCYCKYVLGKIRWMKARAKNQVRGV